MAKNLYIVVPCYNEEEVLASSAQKLACFLDELIKKTVINEKSKIVFVDDGSYDGTWNIINRLTKDYSTVCGIKLSHNVGHQKALVAGLGEAARFADILITIDADLQDDYTLIPEMIKKCEEGAEIVYGVRNDRRKDTFFKRTTATLFYKVMRSLGGEIIYNHADFRLMSKRAVDFLLQYKEVNLFLRGIIPMIGLKTDCVEYERKERTAGKTKYPLNKMISFAIEGITSLSIKPLCIVVAVGFLITTISIIMIIWMVIQHFEGNTISGWTSVIASLWFLGGIIVFSLGIIGEYIGKIYIETKQRPLYFVENMEGFDADV